MNLNNYICTHSLYLTWGSSSTFNPDISYISLLSQINTQEGMVPYYFIMLKKNVSVIASMASVFLLCE